VNSPCGSRQPERNLAEAIGSVHVTIGTCRDAFLHQPSSDLIQLGGAGPNVAVHQNVKIALVAPPFIAVPPPGYGGTELFIGSLATALLGRGHEVVVYANGESYGRFEVRALYPTSEWPPAAGAAGQFRNLAHYAWAVRDAASTCDVVHINDVAGVLFSSYIPQPVLQTLHHSHDEMLSNLYALHTAVTYVAISDAQRRRERMARLVTVHHGIDCSQYRMGEDKDEFVAFLGRIAPCKGVDVAIKVARMSGVRLKIAGQIQAEFREFWESNVKPQVDGQLIEYVGEADISVKNELLGRARALLFPIQWDEPFGLVMLEAMACGTPVIAFDRGSVGEVVVHGSTGWICQSADEMAAVVGELATISSWACRRHVEEHFSVERMASDYERVYQWALSDREGPHDQFVPVTEAPGASDDHANGASRMALTDTRA
jgi:glycosyltransferase involved in cell wall biosynthesis